MAVHRPRHVAVLDVPIDGGETIIVPMRVQSANLDSNDHLHADELELTGDIADVGVDPRFVRDANVAYWLEDVKDETQDITSKPARFLGIALEVARRKSAAGNQLTLKCVDYTSLFLSCKPFPPDGIPAYSDTLLDAWQKICDHTGVFSLASNKLVSTVAALRSAIDFRGGASASTTLGQAVSARIRKQGGEIIVKPHSDAWAVWQHCVGMCGLVSYIDGNRCVVTTTVDLFADDGSAPALVWGSNILEHEERASARQKAKGVALVSFDPLTGTTIEAFYPEPGDARFQAQKRPTAKRSAKASVATTEIKSEDYEFQSYPGVTDPAVLFDVARTAYDQRSRQELEGKLTTAEFQVGAPNGGQVDLIGLRSGSSLSVQIDPEIERGVFSTLSNVDRIQYLLARGYSDSAARLIAATAKQRMKYGFTFKAKKVRTELATQGDSGSFRVHVDYWNCIELI